MGLLSRLFGRAEPRRSESSQAQPPAPVPGGVRDPDRAAVERYRYLLRTAPPDQVEQAHEEAFAQLTPEQRREVLGQLATVVPASEQHGDDPRSLARTATRAEVRRPGTLVQIFNGGAGLGGRSGYGGGFGGGMGMGLGGTLLTSVAGAFVGTAIADALIPDDFGNEHWGDDQAYEAGPEQGYDEGLDQGDEQAGSGGGSFDEAGFDGGGFDGGFDDGGFDGGGDLDV